MRYNILNQILPAIVGVIMSASLVIFALPYTSKPLPYEDARLENVVMTSTAIDGDLSFTKTGCDFIALDSVNILYSEERAVRLTVAISEYNGIYKTKDGLNTGNRQEGAQAFGFTLERQDKLPLKPGRVFLFTQHGCHEDDYDLLTLRGGLPARLDPSDVNKILASFVVIGKDPLAP